MTSDQDTHPNAGRSSGYIPEDLVNKVTIIVSGVQTSLLQESQRQDQRFSYLLNEIKTFTDAIDARLDVYGRDIDTVLSVVREVADQQKKSELQYEVLATDVSAITTDLAALTARVAIVEQTPGTYPDLLKGMQHLEQMVTKVSEQSARRDSRVLKVAISSGAVVFLLIILAILYAVRT